MVWNELSGPTHDMVHVNHWQALMERQAYYVQHSGTRPVTWVCPTGVMSLCFIPFPACPPPPQKER